MTTSASLSTSFPRDSFLLVERPIRAVLFDLDDTLYPQDIWLATAWDAVADEAACAGVDRAAFRSALGDVAAEGSGKGRIIDRAADRIGADVDVGHLVETFRTCEVRLMSPYAGVTRALENLQRCFRTGLVTDGDPRIQRGKLHALRLERSFDAVVFSDEAGREFRKPSPVPLLRAARRLGVDPSECVYVGDRPDKDVAAAQAANMRAVRVRTGEYAALPDEPPPWLSVESVPVAIKLLNATRPSHVHR